MNILNLGQVFTEDNIVESMLALRKNQGSVLEPSAGKGAFFNKIPGATGIEIDSEFCPPGCQLMDFFDYSLDYRFKTIIGNPPYVAYKHICDTTKSKLVDNWDAEFCNAFFNALSINKEVFDERTNLYLFFIWKCILHLERGGELIFITPRDFLKATSARNLNEVMYEMGTLTHFYETGDEVIFPGVAPNCAIWRFELNNKSHITETNDGLRNQVLIDGQICFTETEYAIDFKKLFSVHVGAVSGADKIYTHPNGNYEFVCSYTKKTGKTKKMFYQVINDYLLGYKNELLARKVRHFDETNWWCWGREQYISDLPRVYVNSKTRLFDPFFSHPCRNFDGSVLGILIKVNITENEAAHALNQVNWAELGFKVGGRYVFSQRALENIKLPVNLFGKYLEKKNDRPEGICVTDARSPGCEGGIGSETTGKDSGIC